MSNGPVSQYTLSTSGFGRSSFRWRARALRAGRWAPPHTSRVVSGCRLSWVLSQLLCSLAVLPHHGSC